MISYDCHKCDGLGTLKHFSHVQSGICYDCNGTGKLSAVADVDGPELSWVEYHIGGEDTAFYLEWNDTRFAYNCAVDCIGDTGGLSFKLSNFRADTLQEAKQLVEKKGGTFFTQWIRIIEFASICYLLGDAGIERGRSAVVREHGDDWLKKYNSAVTKLQDIHTKAPV